MLARSHSAAAQGPYLVRTSPLPPVPGAAQHTTYKEQCPRVDSLFSLKSWVNFMKAPGSTLFGRLAHSTFCLLCLFGFICVSE
jgi:hypothetical protein